MGRFKALSRSDAVRRPLCWLGARYIRLVYATGRWEVLRGDIPAAFWDRGEPFILTFWHGRILMMPFSWRRALPIRMLILKNDPDGQIIARIVGHLGIDTVSGSSTRGGEAALRAMVRSLKQGICVGITPDGPRGPYMRAADGVVHLARLSGAQVIPCAVAVARRRVLGTWDRFILAWPWSRGVFVWGAPIHVGRGGDEAAVETSRLEIERAINAVTAEADERMGHAPLIPPGAAP